MELVTVDKQHIRKQPTLFSNGEKEDEEHLIT